MAFNPSQQAARRAISHLATFPRFQPITQKSLQWPVRNYVQKTKKTCNLGTIEACKQWRVQIDRPVEHNDHSLGTQQNPEVRRLQFFRISEE